MSAELLGLAGLKDPMPKGSSPGLAPLLNGFSRWLAGGGANGDVISAGDGLGASALSTLNGVEPNKSTVGG